VSRFLTIACVVAALGLGRAGADEPKQPGDPEILYADRTHLPSALEAASIWESRAKSDSRDFDATWKLARACYWLGGHVAESGRRAQFERGREAGRKASELRADRPEGFFWMAANMGALAESFGLDEGLKYRGAIRKALETVLRIDRPFQNGSADRALGRWYFKVPALFGGSNRKSLEHLERSLTYDAKSLASHYFLAETYEGMNRSEAARAEAQAVIALPVDPDWAPEDLEFKQKARALLEGL
jgi:hypothetical protein